MYDPNEEDVQVLGAVAQATNTNRDSAIHLLERLDSLGYRIVPKLGRRDRDKARRSAKHALANRTDDDSILGVSPGAAFDAGFVAGLRAAGYKL